MAVRVIPPHGTRARYSHRDPEVRCRLECCRGANTRYQRTYRREGATTWTTRPDGFRQLRMPIGR
jgi:hypothetical protein